LLLASSLWVPVTVAVTLTTFTEPSLLLVKSPEEHC
jgi:hypothetical protein